MTKDRIREALKANGCCVCKACVDATYAEIMRPK